MAIKIPTQDAPRISSTQMPTPYESASGQSAVAGAFQLAGTAINEAAKVELQHKNEADSQARLEAENALRKFTDAGLQAVKNAEGRNAAAAALKFYAEADKKAKDLFGGLTGLSEHQKTAFSNNANAELAQSQKIGEAHVSEQIKAADVSEFNAANANGLTRSSNNIHVPGIAEEEVGNLEKRIFGETVNGVMTPGFAERRGMPAEAAKALRDKLVGQVYSDKAERLMDLGDVQGAEAVVKAHTTEMGEHAKELLGKIESKARIIRADAWATGVANDPAMKLRDGNLNTVAIEEKLQKDVPAGEERLLYRAAVSHRFEQIKQGVEAKEKANWDALLDDYHNKGRSYWAVVADSPAWGAANAQQQEHLYQRWLADQREKRGEPPSEQQLAAFGRLSYDIASRSDFWGTSDVSQLTNDNGYHMLTEPLQRHLIDMVTNAQKDRSSIAGQIQFVDKVALQRAQTDGHPLSGSAGKKYEQLDPDQQQNWDAIRDGVHAEIQAWKNKNPKATYIPVEEINNAVDKVTRTATVKEGRWYFLGLAGHRSGVLLSDVGDRPVDRLDVSANEEKIGRDVLRRQGHSEKEMTPEAIINAAGAKRELSSGPPPQERQKIISALRASGAQDPEDQALIQATYEKTKLKYVR